MSFFITHKEGKARAGKLITGHGEIATPVFMPVGTVGSVKGVLSKELVETVKARIILGNTYHLYLRPGTEILKKAGGLHRFIGWEKPILTDSGGYQVYSLTDIRKMDPEGVTFQSHIDGSRHRFTAENVIDIERAIGADIIMAFDECAPYPATHDYAKKSMEMTHNWLQRCVNHYHATEPLYGYEQYLFPIVQGSIYPDLRQISAEFASSFDMKGYAIGGLSVGEPAEQMYEIAELVCDILPKEKPRYLMGVGTPANIIRSVGLGVDMFDCVMPTRNGRNGMLFTRNGIINIKNKKWADDFSPIEDSSPIDIDQTTSKAYLRHLFAAGEMLGPIIASIHNLSFYLRLVDEIREQIINGTYYEWAVKAEKETMTRL